LQSANAIAGKSDTKKARRMRFIIKLA
jgi:hypothetical protein